MQPKAAGEWNDHKKALFWHIEVSDVAIGCSSSTKVPCLRYLRYLLQRYVTVEASYGTLFYLRVKVETDPIRTPLQ